MYKCKYFFYNLKIINDNSLQIIACQKWLKKKIYLDIS